MRIIFIRHGEPDYTKDSLTEKGRREAALLAQRISKWNVAQFYCSPLGRAKDTASYTLKKLHAEAITLPWMREFSYPIDDPVTKRHHSVPWDFVPSYWTNEPLMYDIDRWTQADVMKQNPMIETAYKDVCKNFDDLLASYGYVRKNNFYQMPGKTERFITRTVAEDGSPVADQDDDCLSEPTIAIFCHLGIICIVLSHLLNIPFPLLTHGFFLPTTSLTIVSSEEHWSNEAYFRVQAMGDVHHLLDGKEPISSAGSFVKAFQG